MASSASLKDLSKAIVTYFADPTAPPPEELSQVIDGYLRRHQKYDDAAADRLQEELLVIFDKYVRNSPAHGAPWLAVLRRLIPILRTSERIFAWWDSTTAITAVVSPEKVIVTESLAILMEILSLAEECAEESDEDVFSGPLISRLLAEWIDRLYPATSEGVTTADYNEKIIREALIQLGTRHPKNMFNALDRYFVKKQYRKSILKFITDYLQSQPPHIHLILQTPLFCNILRCLQYDTSTTIVSVALTALIMLLPHMPSSLVPHLPTLFNIYARLLFWARERAGIVEPQQDDSDQDGPWEAYGYEPKVDDHPVDHLLNYYTILYGLYPINFMDYIRKPQRYLRHANVANANDMEVQPTEIRHQSEKFRRHHLLHPNFYTLTVDSEKTDFSRWIKSETSEVVAECMGLCLMTELNQVVGQTLPSIPAADIPMSEASVKDGQDPSLISGSSIMEPQDPYRAAQSVSMESVVSSLRPSGLTRQGSGSSHPSTRDSVDTKNKEFNVDSPTLPPYLPQSASHTQLQDMIQSNKAIKSGLNQTLANDSVPSLALSHQDSVAERFTGFSTINQQIGSPLSLTEANPQTAHLQRRILILSNDLNFERFLKQQHMAHIGELRRRHLEEAATEAETQNLVIMNRNLKSRYEEAKKAEIQVRRDSEKSRGIAKKWEADLANKLKKLRDDSKKLKAEFEATQKELEKTRAECLKLRVMLGEAEVKELNWKQNMQSIELHGAEIDRLKSEVSRLTTVERDYQAKELERQGAMSAAAEAEERAQKLSIELASRDSEIERTKKLFQSQIAALQIRLSEANEGGHGRASPRAREAIEGALAASREKQAELQRQCNLLTRKYTALQSSLLDMKTGASPGQLRIDTSRSPEGDNEYMSLSGSPLTMKTRPHRVLSNPEALETAYNVTPPLEPRPKPGTPLNVGWAQRPGSPAGTDWSGDGSLSMSPDHRPFARSESAGRLLARSHSDLFAGSPQNRMRRDSRDRIRDEIPGKKDKKSSGLRGIRGFMNE